MVENCLFCKIIAHEVSAEIVYEDNASLGVMDIHPRSAGHVFMIPKKHYATLIDMPAEEVGPLFVAVKNVTAQIARALHPDGFTIGINHGRAGGQEIDHLHIHIMPRMTGDGGSAVQGVVGAKSDESVAVIAAKIRATA